MLGPTHNNTASQRFQVASHFFALRGDKSLSRAARAVRSFWRRPESSLRIQNWMPDQVRHDEHYGTPLIAVQQAGRTSHPERSRRVHGVRMGSFCVFLYSLNRIGGDSEARISLRRVGPSSDPPFFVGGRRPEVVPQVCHTEVVGYSVHRRIT